MLVAQLDTRRIEAREAARGPAYHCPRCRRPVILKKGRIVTHHFAHKPPVDCAWGRGETDAHREAKTLFRDEFARRGHRAAVEHEVASLPDDRRADVVVWSPAGHAYALELQHTALGYASLEHRTLSYIRAGVRVIWLPFLRPGLWEGAKRLDGGEDGDFRIDRFPARPLEKWVHGFYYGRFWMYDPEGKAVWLARLTKHQVFVDHVAWYDDDGEQQHAGGYWKTSKRWRTLTLWGPFGLDRIKVEPLWRKPVEMGRHRYPGGMVATFTV